MVYMPRYGEAVQSRFAFQSRIRKGQTMRKLGSVLILCAATLCFSGCAWRNLGPCYGVGCPTFTMSESAPGPNSAVASAPAHKWWHLKKAQAQNTKTAQPQTNSGQ